MKQNQVWSPCHALWQGDPLFSHCRHFRSLLLGLLGQDEPNLKVKQKESQTIRKCLMPVWVNRKPEPTSDTYSVFPPGPRPLGSFQPWKADILQTRESNCPEATDHSFALLAHANRSIRGWTPRSAKSPRFFCTASVSPAILVRSRPQMEASARIRLTKSS